MYKALSSRSNGVQINENIHGKSLNVPSLPSSRVMLGLYQYLEVSFTNLGVACTMSESEEARTAKFHLHYHTW